jgi:glycosyltransferase involved in cell wall biosynthesis
MKGGVTLVLNCLRSGGAEKQLLWIASEIISLGRPCTILELSAGKRTERIEAMVHVAITKGVFVLRAPAGSGTLRGLWRLRSHLILARPELIWSWGSRADGLCLLNRVGRSSGKWLISIRCTSFGARTVGTWAQTSIAKFCDGVVSNTYAGLEIRGANQMPGVRQWVLPNAVRRDPIGEIMLPKAPPEKLVLVMLGNIKLHHKGYDLAAELASRLCNKAFPFELRIAGRPDELVEFETIFRRLNVQSAVKFFGEVSDPENFLREGHLFLLLSRYEGMPNTLLEALNVGLPAIATDVGDLRVLKEKGAPFVLIPIENVSAAAEAVEKAVAQWADTRMAAAKGRSWVQKNFSEETCRTVLRNILREVMGS